MGAEGVEGQFQRLDHGNGAAAEPAKAPWQLARLRYDAPKAADTFDRSYAQTVLRML